MDWLKKLFWREPANPVKQAIEPDPEPEPKPKPKVDPYTVEYDDWEQYHDDWHPIQRCHCGYQMPILNGVSLVPVGRVCPKCGHTDKWQTKVVRYEWEYSHKKFKAITEYRRSFYTCDYDHVFVDAESTRNKKLVEWTEDHCKINEDSSQ